eukprot:jgi/Botrbrau1/13352/Bobra.0158s0006.1
MRKTKGDLRIYQSWQHDTLGDDTPLEKLCRADMTARLQTFIMQVRQQKQKSGVCLRYKRSSLIAIVGSIQRWLSCHRARQYRDT